MMFAVILGTYSLTITLLSTGTPRGDKNPCTAGSYSNNTANYKWEQCEKCPEGHYCPVASVLPTPCPA